MTLNVDTQYVEKWAPIFAAIGSSVRLAILLILYGSMFTRGEECLTFTEIRNVLGVASDTTLSYHLQKLAEAGLVEKQPAKNEKGRVFPLYSVSKKWIDFLKETGLSKPFLEYTQKWKKT